MPLHTATCRTPCVCTRWCAECPHGLLAADRVASPHCLRLGATLSRHRPRRLRVGPRPAAAAAAAAAGSGWTRPRPSRPSSARACSRAWTGVHHGLSCTPPMLAESDLGRARSGHPTEHAVARGHTALTPHAHTTYSLRRTASKELEDWKELRRSGSGSSADGGGGGGGGSGAAFVPSRCLPRSPLGGGADSGDGGALAQLSQLTVQPAPTWRRID
jgi:hypothetical protein